MHRAPPFFFASVHLTQSKSNQQKVYHFPHGEVFFILKMCSQLTKNRLPIITFLHFFFLNKPTLILPDRCSFQLHFLNHPETKHSQ